MCPSPDGAGLYKCPSVLSVDSVASTFLPSPSPDSTRSYSTTRIGTVSCRVQLEYWQFDIRVQIISPSYYNLTFMFQVFLEVRPAGFSPPGPFMSSTLWWPCSSAPAWPWSDSTAASSPGLLFSCGWCRLCLRSSPLLFCWSLSRWVHQCD